MNLGTRDLKTPYFFRLCPNLLKESLFNVFNAFPLLFSGDYLDNGVEVSAFPVHSYKERACFQTDFPSIVKDLTFDVNFPIDFLLKFRYKEVLLPNEQGLSEVDGEVGSGAGTVIVY